MRYHISLKRVLFMTVLSVGLYLFYWFYITWKRYRDHTQAEASRIEWLPVMMMAQRVSKG